MAKWDWSKVAGYSLLGGVGIFGAYFLLQEWEKKKLIDEFTAKVQRYQDAYLNAINKGDYEGAQSISDTYETLMNEEVQVIEQKGALATLIDTLAKLGIVVGGLGALYLGSQIVKYLMKKFPPNYPKCPLDGQTFPSTEALDAHLQAAHHFDTSAVTAAQSAYHSLGGFYQRLVTAFSGFTDAELSTPWGQLPVWMLLLIAFAACLIVALTWGTAAPAMAPLLAMAAA